MHSFRCLRNNPHQRAPVQRQRSRSRHPSPVAMRTPERIGRGYGHYLTRQAFTHSKVILISGGVGKYDGDRSTQAEKFEKLLNDSTALERCCLRRRDIQKIMHRSDSDDYIRGSARDDHVYYSIRNGNKFQQILDEEVEWICGNIFSTSIEKVVLAISCRSGKHRSVGIIRGIAESLQERGLQFQVIQLDTADMNQEDIITAGEWMRCYGR